MGGDRLVERASAEPAAWAGPAPPDRSPAAPAGTAGPRWPAAGPPGCPSCRRRRGASGPGAAPPCPAEWRTRTRSGRAAASDVGVGSGTHGSDGGSIDAALGLGVEQDVDSSTPDAPSMVAWWSLVNSPTSPPCRPVMTYHSQSGRVRSSGRAASRDTCSASWASSPGAGRASSRMWYSRSRSPSSTQYGLSSPKGTLNELAAVHLQQVQPLRPRPGGGRRTGRRCASVEGSRIERELTWPNCVGRLHGEEARVEPGELLHRSPPSMRSGPRSACSGVLSQGRRASGRCRRSSGPPSPR